MIRSVNSPDQWIHLKCSFHVNKLAFICCGQVSELTFIFPGDFTGFTNPLRHPHSAWIPMINLLCDSSHVDWAASETKLDFRPSYLSHYCLFAKFPAFPSCKSLMFKLYLKVFLFFSMYFYFLPIVYWL